MSCKATVVARNVSKDYRETGLRLRKSISREREVNALKGVSMVVSEGESVGLIGTNGSGKSTLLNIISGGEALSGGDVWTSAKPTLLSVGAVLQSASTGWQNIQLGLLAKGLPRKEVEALTRSAGEWSELGSALSRPIGTYSSGMRARLKFSIATAVPSEILLVDEALGTGDASFAAKAKRRMQEFLENSASVIVVSHSANTIKAQCSRAIWLEQGRVVADGEVHEVVDNYTQWSKLVSEDDLDDAEILLAELEQEYIKPCIVFDREAERYWDRAEPGA